MKCSLIGKNKILLIAVLTVVLCGMIFLGIFGLNKSIDNKDGYEMQVKLSLNYDDSSDIAKNACKEFFKSNGMSVKSYANQTLDDGEVLIYKSEKDYSSKVQALKEYVDGKLEGATVSGITCEVLSFKVSPSGYGQSGFVALSLAVICVVAFVYLFFTAKLAGALSVVASAVTSSVLFFSLMSITRVPAYPFFATLIVFAFAFTALLSTVLINRFKEERANVGNSKYTNKELVILSYKKSLLRIAFVCIAVLVFACPMCVLAGCYGTFLALGLLIVLVSSLLAICTITPVVYLAINKADKNK